MARTMPGSIGQKRISGDESRVVEELLDESVIPLE